MPIYSLSCANCSAPLEVGSDMERFICAHCGSAQILERKGGTISLKNMEASLHAIQRGTDRTAAELALPRLTREKEDILAQRTEALEAHAERRARARGRRKKLTLIVFFIVLIIGGVVSPGFGPLLSCAWILGLIAIPGFVFRSIRMPLDSRQRIMDEYDARLAPVERQLQANRSILEILPI